MHISEDACLVLSDQRPVAAAKFSAAQTPRVLVTGSSWGIAAIADTRVERLEFRRAFGPAFHMLCFCPKLHNDCRVKCLLSPLIVTSYCLLAAGDIRLHDQADVQPGAVIGMQPAPLRADMLDIAKHPQGVHQNLSTKGSLIPDQ